jgi:hypothetical protein
VSEPFGWAIVVTKDFEKESGRAREEKRKTRAKQQMAQAARSAWLLDYFLTSSFFGSGGGIRKD